MKARNKWTAGRVARSRTAFTVVAATLLIGGTVTEASAKSRHHDHPRHHHYTHHARNMSGATWHSADSHEANTSSPFEAMGRVFSGLASFYGNESGRQTASGQRFDQSKLTCAHRSLPFGTKLRVTHDGRSVVVTVNDRGPYVKGRILDLSTAAARAVGLTSAGVGHVTAEIVG
jgi:rare lipoprotein A